MIPLLNPYYKQQKTLAIRNGSASVFLLQRVFEKSI